MGLVEAPSTAGCPADGDISEDRSIAPALKECEGMLRALCSQSRGPWAAVVQVRGVLRAACRSAVSQAGWSQTGGLTVAPQSR